jgi:methylenetetrahydrofolate--tRNA-(uracil-5-)-methyltransferase
MDVAMRKFLTIIGAGLAGCEAAWQAAQKGLQVTLYEMRPQVETGAHQTDGLAELVCSNSLGSNLPDRASGLLKEELRHLGSLLLECAGQTAVPAGGALAVDRDAFSQLITEKITAHPNITLVREEVKRIPQGGPVIIASGPLTSSALSADIHQWSGQDNLFFFDAVAPIIAVDSLNMDIAFRASRYDRGDQEQGDYINAPLNKEEYGHFIESLLKAERIVLQEFETAIQEGVRAGSSSFFEGCLPVEIIASRGHDALAYGPMRPVGLHDPRTGRRPYAVLQLRQDNLAGDLYNMVGFQTNLKFPAQKEVFRLIPGLENAEFVRYGQMHRNTFIASPLLLHPTLQAKDRSQLFFAGQITGVEGYIGNIATGLLAGLNVVRQIAGQDLLILPETTMLGALCRYITQADMKDFQPMKANFGIVPPLEQPVKGKRQRAAAYAQRSIDDLQAFIQSHGLHHDG